VLSPYCAEQGLHQGRLVSHSKAGGLQAQLTWLLLLAGDWPRGFMPIRMRKYRLEVDADKV